MMLGAAIGARPLARDGLGLLSSAPGEPLQCGQRRLLFGGGGGSVRQGHASPPAAAMPSE